MSHNKRNWEDGVFISGTSRSFAIRLMQYSKMEVEVIEHSVQDSDRHEDKRKSLCIIMLAVHLVSAGGKKNS